MGRAATPGLAVAGLLLNAFFWGLSWWPLKQLEAQGLHPLWVTAGVFVVAALALVVISASGWRYFKTHPALWWLAVASGLTNVGFNWAVTTGDVVRVVLLFYLMPAWSLLLAWWLLQERPSRGALLRLSLALVGVVCVLKTPHSPWPWPQDLADWLALGAGFCFAMTNIWLLRLEHLPTSARMVGMFGGSALMGLLCAVLASSTGVIGAVPLATAASLPWLTWTVWVVGLSAAFLFANFCLQYGVARLSAHTTSIVMMSEVVFASVSSVALGAATLNWRVGLGGGMIVLAALLSTHSSPATKPPADA